MSISQSSWRAEAEAKVAATLSEITPEWKLEHGVIIDAKNQRQLAGDFIIRLLDPETVKIISHDSRELVVLIEKKTYTAFQVTLAYCKTAAVAHQIVGATQVPIIMKELLLLIQHINNPPN